jgi:hypothetical protein
MLACEFGMRTDRRPSTHRKRCQYAVQCQISKVAAGGANVQEKRRIGWLVVAPHPGERSTGGRSPPDPDDYVVPQGVVEVPV